MTKQMDFQAVFKLYENAEHEQIAKLIKTI